MGRLKPLAVMEGTVAILIGQPATGSSRLAAKIKCHSKPSEAYTATKPRRHFIAIAKSLSDLRGTWHGTAPGKETKLNTGFLSIFEPL